MTDGALVNVSPPPDPAPGRKRRDQAIGAAGDLRAEEKYCRRLDLPDPLHQERQASLLIVMVRLPEEAPDLFGAGEKTDEPVGAKTLSRIRTGLGEQRVQVAPRSLVILAACRLNFLAIHMAAEVVPDGDDRGALVTPQGGIT